MKWYQYLAIFFVIGIGIALYFVMKFNLNEKYKNQIVFNVKDTSLKELFPDPYANLKSVNLYKYFSSSRTQDTLIKIELVYAGNIYDYSIEFLMKPIPFYDKLLILNKNQLISHKLEVIYQSSFSVYFTKQIVLPQPESLAILLSNQDSIFTLYGFYQVDNEALNLKVSFFKDSVRMYKYEVL